MAEQAILGGTAVSTSPSSPSCWDTKFTGFGWWIELRTAGSVYGVTIPLLTEGDVVRGQPPDLTSPHWRCGIVDPATGAVCTRRPHGEDEQHQGWAAVQGTGRSTRLVSWSEGSERAMVVDGYTWSRIPGTDIEVRALSDRPLALRYRPRA